MSSSSSTSDITSPKPDMAPSKPDILVRTMLLPGILDKQKIISFLNIHHKTVSNTTTLITEQNYNTITKIGTVCSYIMRNDLSPDEIKKDEDLLGIIFTSMLTININETTIKSGYTTYLCVDKKHRKKNYSRFLINGNDKFCRTNLKTNNSYFLSYKDWGNGVEIRSFYRVISYENMKKAGFGVINKSKPKVKRFYHIKKTVGYIVIDGIDNDIKFSDRNFDIFWNPTQSEKERYSSLFNFRTVIYKHSKMAFSIFPLECLVNETGEIVKIAMLSYFYVTDKSLTDDFFKIVLQIAQEEGYDCLYSYLIGDINKRVALENSSHITDMKYYLNFYGITVVGINLETTNLLLY